jgi:hypothetical protein
MLQGSFRKHNKEKPLKEVDKTIKKNTIKTNIIDNLLLLIIKVSKMNVYR